MNEGEIATVLAAVMDLWPKYGERLTDAEQQAWTVALRGVMLDGDTAVAFVRGYWAEATTAAPIAGKIISRMRDEATRRRKLLPPDASRTGATQCRWRPCRYALLTRSGTIYQLDVPASLGDDDEAHRRAAEQFFGEYLGRPGWALIGPVTVDEQRRIADSVRSAKRKLYNQRQAAGQAVPTDERKAAMA